jgi:nucleotide-binding universal stress UspA family protein
MKKFAKILIALEQSELSNIIINYGKTIAGKFRARMILLHVISSEMRYEDHAVNEVGNGILPSSPSVKLAEATYLQAYRWLESMGLSTRDGTNISIEIQVVVALDSVPSEIVNYAEKNKIDFIIIGARRNTRQEKMLLGSVASHVITHAQCPVLVVR